MNNIKIAFFDFDWTLFDHKTHTFIDTAVEAINKIQENGVKIVINSARSYFSLASLKTFEKIKFDAFVVSNGGACFRKDRVLYAHYLNKDALNLLIKICVENDISFLLSTLTGAFIKTSSNPEDTNKFYSVFYEGYPKNIDEYNGEEVIAIQIFCTADKDYLFKDVPNAKPNRFFESCIEFTAKEFIKSEGISALINELGYSIDECCAFGDDVNDIDMFKLVKYGVCMGNGKDEAKKHAYHVTTNIEDDGILQGLKFLKLL